MRMYLVVSVEVGDSGTSFLEFSRPPGGDPFLIVPVKCEGHNAKKALEDLALVIARQDPGTPKSSGQVQGSLKL